MDEVIKQRRDQLTEAIKNGMDPLERIHGLIQINCPLKEKLVRIKGFGELIVKNSETKDNLKQLLMMLNILEKYGRHLLKPADQRSSMWRHIKNSNTIYRDRVARIWGGALIMHMMGYTEEKGDGVAFPEGLEPNHADILELLGDIILGKKELETYLAGQHPHPQIIEEHLNKELLSILNQTSINSNKDIDTSTTGGRVQQPMQQLPVQTAGSPSQQLQALGSQKHGSGSPKVPSLDNKLTLAQQSDMEAQNENRVQSIVCDICGKNQADIVCRICDNKQLCGDCDNKWHSHPKRQNHKRKKLGQPEVPVTPSGGGGPGAEDEASREQKRNVLGELPQGEADNVNSPSAQHSTQPALNNQPIYQQLIRPGTGQSMMYEPVMFPINSSAAHIPSSVPQSPLMYQAQYPPHHFSNQHRLVPAMWPGSQPGSGQYFTANQMLGGGQMPRSSQMTGDGHMTGGSHMTGSNAQHRLGQPMQYPYSIAGGFRENQEVRSSFPGYNPDINQSHTLAYFPASYAGSTPSPVSSDPTSMPRYQAPSPPGQSDSRYHGNRIKTGSQPVYENKQKNIDNIYEVPGQTYNTIKRTASYLVLKLQKIPDLQKRRARLDINLATLKEDVEELEGKINQIIVENENFIQDPEYKDLSIQKQKCLRDIKDLEKYEIELDKIIAESTEEVTLSKGKELEILAQQLSLQPQGQNQEKPKSGQSLMNVSFPPNSTGNITTAMNVTHSDLTANQRREHTHLKPGNPSDISASQKLLLGISAQEEEENFRNAEEERKMMEIRKMLVLGQNPYVQPPAKQKQLHLNIPVSNIDKDTLQQKPLLGEGATYPPQIVIAHSSDKQVQQKAEPKPKILAAAAAAAAAGMPHKASEPNLKVKDIEAEQVRKVASESDLEQWQCEHCTFVNAHSSNVCSVCCKTNDNRKIMSKGLSDQGTVVVGGGDSGVEPCKKCTFHNEKGEESCQICGESLIPVTVALKVDVSPEDGKLGVPKGAAAAGNKKEAASPRTTSLEQKLEAEQDQVFLEKKLAQQRYKEAEANKNNAALSPNTAGKNNAARKTPNTGVDESSFVFVEPGSSLLLTEGVPLHGGYIGPKKILNKKLASLQKTPNQSPPSSNEEFFITPPTSFEQMMPSEGQVIDRRPPANVNFNEAIEQIQTRRAREQMSLDGHDFVMLLKAAEKEGHTLDEVEIAVSRCVDDKVKPLDWLKQKWAEEVEAVIDMVSEVAKNEDVGELSRAEAKEELIKCKGDIKKAGESCIKSRKEKFKEISNECQYSREKILTALYQNEGNVEATIDQLHSYVIKGFSDRVWKQQEPDCGDGAEGPARTPVRAEGRELPVGGAVGGAVGGGVGGAVGGLVSDVKDYEADSVIASEDFQEMMKDKHIDRQRRIRIIFAEAKLQSWGRAETVVIILDTESHQLDDVADCTLDDIIEAVKNCGDRQRSLGYLRQECGICFCYYPMNKIQSLNSCQCKLCRHCLKQNFEVAIREKYVRNWGCPICQAPNFEDEIAASSYFEFLQMLLRTLVDDEIKDLFETKLRDWHLQKEVNFRWCAHCASGFVWDRPNVMGMTCPSCNKKTCFMCKKKWEDQHQGLTCEEFTQWKIDNDPNFQAVGLARHLEENGIDCPSCKMRYDLAKGGCMHFRCPQCGHEFCSGCSESFMQDGTCKLLKDCKGKGLHCHHPRDCFYYLRDNELADLQALLKQNKVEHNTEIPTTQKDPGHCPVMEQKEYGVNKKDEACGKDTQKGMAGLCHMHYKEYLVGLINKNKVDPVDIMGVKELERCFTRMGRQAPKLNRNENEIQYKQRLAKLVRESFPLRR